MSHQRPLHAAQRHDKLTQKQSINTDGQVAMRKRRRAAAPLLLLPPLLLLLLSQHTSAAAAVAAAAAAAAAPTSACAFVPPLRLARRAAAAAAAAAAAHDSGEAVTQQQQQQQHDQHYHHHAPPPPLLLQPRHLAIIPDGNGRWAQQRGLPRAMGHREGAKRVLEVLQACNELFKGIKVRCVAYVCVYVRTYTDQPTSRPIESANRSIDRINQPTNLLTHRLPPPPSHAARHPLLPQHRKLVAPRQRSRHHPRLRRGLPPGQHRMGAHQPHPPHSRRAAGPPAPLPPAPDPARRGRNGGL
jgi:hypothetical protein